MEMVFCFCQKCLDEIDRLYREGETLPEYLNAYTDQLCANCGRKLEIVGTRKFEVEMLNIQEQDGVHQYTEFEVLRFIPEQQAEVEAEPNYLLIISCSQRKVQKPSPLPAIDLYDGPVYRTLRKIGREGRDPENLTILIISAKYGLIHCFAEIEPYDEKMTPQRASELRAGIQAKLKPYLQAHKFNQVFINLGKTYRQTLEGFHWGPVSTMEASGAIGLKTSQMKAWLERIYQERTE